MSRIKQLLTLLGASTVLLGVVAMDASAAQNTPGTVQFSRNIVSSIGLPSTSTDSSGSATTALSRSVISVTSKAAFARSKSNVKAVADENPLSISNITAKVSSGSISATIAGLLGTKPSATANNRFHHPSRNPTTTTLPIFTTTTTIPVFAPTPTTTQPVTTTSVPAGPTTTTTQPAATTTTAPPAPTPTTTTTSPAGTAFPVGTPNASMASGMAPPSASAMAGYSQTNVTEFTGSSLPAGWISYSGLPGGDPGGQFGGPTHSVVSGGVLNLETFQDPNYNNEWVTGGVGQRNDPQTYGAYFVRSRVTGAGPTNVELLWPVANVWPPEIDFNETGGQINSTTATNIWSLSASGSKNQAQVSTSVDMTQWHTYGVIWTPTSITYTVDGKVWGSFNNASEIPSQPMNLDLQQQTWCSSGFACPSAPQSMQINWTAIYSAN